MSFITDTFLSFGNEIFIIIILLVSLGFYYTRDKFNIKQIYLILTGCFIIFKITYASIATWAQYYIWKADQFSQLLLPPHQDISYFRFYSWSHFWLGLCISLGVSILFYIFLKSLNRYRSRFFEKGEVELGFLMALVSGWPGFLIFIPVTFIYVVLVSLVRSLFTNKVYTTLGISMILGAATAFYLQIYLLDFFNLTVFS